LTAQRSALLSIAHTKKCYGPSIFQTISAVPLMWLQIANHQSRIENPEVCGLLQSLTSGPQLAVQTARRVRDPEPDAIPEPARRACLPRKTRSGFCLSGDRNWDDRSALFVQIFPLNKVCHRNCSIQSVPQPCNQCDPCQRTAVARIARRA